MAPFITHAGCMSWRRLMRLRTGSPVANNTASSNAFSRKVRDGWLWAGTSLTLSTESAPVDSSSATTAPMSADVRSGEVGCRIITASNA